MRQQIAAILEGLPDVKVEQIGTLWRISVANFAGARTDGVSLAHDLRTQYEAREVKYMAPEWKAEPEEIEIPRFLAPDPLEDVPASLQDLAEPDETPQAMQARLWALWLELNGKLMLGLATPEETALHSRLHNELHWFAPPIEGE